MTTTIQRSFVFKTFDEDGPLAKLAIDVFVTPPAYYQATHFSFRDDFIIPHCTK